MVKNTGMYAFYDDVYLAEIGLASPWKALLLVYKSSYGETGFQTEEVVARFAKFLLSDAAFSINNGQLHNTGYFDSDEENAYSKNIMWGHAGYGVTIHSPGEEIYKEAEYIRNVRESERLNQLKLRYGKAVQTAPPSRLQNIDLNGSSFNAQAGWLLANSKYLCRWNRWTDFGVSPTIIFHDDKNLLSSIEDACKSLGIVFTLVTREKYLPFW